MKQKILFLVALLMTVLTFTACSSDDDEDNRTNLSIVGTWYSEYDDDGDEIQFNSNGTCTDVTTMLSAPAIKSRLSGTYSVSGDKLTLRWTKDEDWSNSKGAWVNAENVTETYTVTFSVSGNKLTLYSGSGESQTFTKK